MPRKLNPVYIRRIMAKDVLRGMEVVYLTGYIFNVATTDERLPSQCKCIGINKSGGQLLQIQTDYHGWTTEGKLYCRKCWACLVGMPRDIIRRNWCEGCNAKLYPDDDVWLDSKDSSYTGTRLSYTWGLPFATICNSSRVADTCCPTASCRKAITRIISTRFETVLRTTSHRLSSRLRRTFARLRASPTYRKGTSACTLEEMLAKYDAFLQTNPEWPEVAEQFYLRQETFICNA